MAKNNQKRTNDIVPNSLNSLSLEERLNRVIETGFFDQEEQEFSEYENLILLESGNYWEFPGQTRTKENDKKLPL